MKINAKMNFENFHHVRSGRYLSKLIRYQHSFFFWNFCHIQFLDDTQCICYRILIKIFKQIVNQLQNFQEKNLALKKLN